MDNADIARKHEQQLRELVAKNIQGDIKVESAFFCRECDDPIPEKRRLAVPGCQMCIECQRRLERGA